MKIFTKAHKDIIHSEAVRCQPHIAELGTHQALIGSVVRRCPAYAGGPRGATRSLCLGLRPGSQISSHSFSALCIWYTSSAQTASVDSSQPPRGCPSSRFKTRYTPEHRRGRSLRRCQAAGELELTSDVAPKRCLIVEVGGLDGVACYWAKPVSVDVPENC